MITEDSISDNPEKKLPLEEVSTENPAENNSENVPPEEVPDAPEESPEKIEEEKVELPIEEIPLPPEEMPDPVEKKEVPIEETPDSELFPSNNNRNISLIWRTCKKRVLIEK